jgi:hypothetical protein
VEGIGAAIDSSACEGPFGVLVTDCSETRREQSGGLVWIGVVEVLVGIWGKIGRKCRWR